MLISQRLVRQNCHHLKIKKTEKRMARKAVERKIRRAKMARVYRLRAMLLTRWQLDQNVNQFIPHSEGKSCLLKTEMTLTKMLLKSQRLDISLCRLECREMLMKAKSRLYQANESQGKLMV